MKTLATCMLAMIAATATAAPKHRRHKAKAEPVEPAPVAEPTPAPAPVPAPPPVAAVVAPTPPTLAMRPRAPAHGGSIADLDCAACHTEQGWKLAATPDASGFDHDRTGFPLRGAHVQRACAACHTGGASPATSCEGCHHDPHQGRNTQPCAECHTATAWADTAALDRHRLTRMPLTGRHALIDCRDCHKRQTERVFSDTPSDCYACHAASYRDPQLHPVHDGSTGHAPFPRDCALCHRTSGWQPAFAEVSTLARSSTIDHDAMFAISTGSHRGVECAACHVDPQRTKLVRCDGCHQDVALRAQHRRPIAAATASTCLHCHPRGGAR